MRVSYWSPLPPERSGIADYSALLLPALEQRLEVVVVRPGRTRPVADTDVALYHVGNNPDVHGWIVDALRRRPGVVVLHDFVLHHLIAGVTIGRKDGHAYLAAMEREAGVPGRLLGFGVLEGRVPPLWEVRAQEFPLAGEILDRATGVICHSQYVATRAREAGYEGPLWVVSHPAWPVPRLQPAGVEGAPLYGAFGFLNESKRVPQLLEAFALVRRDHPGARLLLVGASSPGFDLDRRIDALGLDREGVIREQYVPEQRLWELMAACDAVVALRAPTMGETSGTAVRALSLGKPLVVSDVGWFAELPDEVALKVAPQGGAEEAAALAVALGGLAADEARREEMGSAARDLAEREHDLGRVADRYAAALEYAAGTRAVEASILREVAAAAAVARVGPEQLAQQLAETGLVGSGNGHGAPGVVPVTVTETWLGRTVRLPVAFWLIAIVAVSAAVQFLLARRVVSPWIMVDELVYSDAARSFAATGHFLIRGVHANYGIVYPALLALPYKLFGSMTSVYAAAKALNAVLMSLAALPAYFLARRVLRAPAALVAAALAVVLPSLAYAGMLMTENAFYPLFLCLVLALVAMLERPTPLRQVLVLALCALLFLTRAQAVALVVAVLTAPLALAWIERGRPRRLGRFAPLYGLTALGALAVILTEVARGRSPAAALGNYSQTSGGHYQAWPAFKWVIFHVAGLDLALFALPFAAAIVLAASARHLDRSVRVFVAAAASVTVWLVLEVAVFASHYSQRIEERNLFYVMPLFLIALLVWIERGQPRPPRATVVAAGLAAVLPGVLPFFLLLHGVSSASDTFGLQPWWFLQNRLLGSSSVALVAVSLAVALAGVFLFLSRRLAGWLPAIVVAGFLCTWLPLELWYYGIPSNSVAALYQGIGTGHQREWIDAAVGRDANVAVLASTTVNPFAVQENEFWNRSVRRVYNLTGHPFGGGMPERKATVVEKTGLLTSGGKPLDAQYVLTDAGTPIVGTLVARDDNLAGGNGIRLFLYRAAQPVRLAQRIVGRYPDGWSAPTLLFVQPDCRGGKLVVELTSDATTFPKGQTVKVIGTTASRTIVVGPHATVDTALPLHAVSGTCRVRFVSSPTRVPGNGDTRLLGARFRTIRYVPPKR